MLIENIELNLSHLGLGNLNEYALMVLFGNACGHQLTLDRDCGFTQMEDHQGRLIHPAYYHTHVRVPAHTPLSSFKLWDRVSLGVEVERFGHSLLESHYVLGKEGTIARDREQWKPTDFPTMHGNNLMVIEGSETSGGSATIAVPQKKCIADLPQSVIPPAAIQKASDVRSRGFGMDDFSGYLKNEEPILYQVHHHRDAAPGQSMLFAKFCEIMDEAEFQFLSNHLRPGFQSEVLTQLNLLEREIFYYANCFAGETLEIYLKGDLQECASNFHGYSKHFQSLATLTWQIEIYQQKNNALLAMANVRKLLTLPTNVPTLPLHYGEDVRRLIFQHTPVR